MNITKRTKISLAQLLDELDKANLKVLFDKYGMNSYFTNVEDIKNIVLDSPNLIELIKEIVEQK